MILTLFYSLDPSARANLAKSIPSSVILMPVYFTYSFNENNTLCPIAMKKQITIILMLVASGLSGVVLAKSKLHPSRGSTFSDSPLSNPFGNNEGNLGAIRISNPASFSKIYALSDVHGMYSHLMTLLQTAGIINSQGQWRAGNALLIVIGDSIDKGPQSVEVIDFWMNLSTTAPQAGGAVLHLLGNHEAEFLANPTDPSVAKGLKSELASKGIPLEQLYDPTYPRAQFLRSLPIAAQVGAWMFAHSGYLEQNTFSQMVSLARPLLQAGNYADSLLQGPTSILEAKAWWETDSATRETLESRLAASSLTGLVFGHQPGALNVRASDAVSSDGKLIKVDNGMAPEAGANPGSVLVFENPTEMSNLNAPISIATIHSGNPEHVALPLEVPGPPQVSDGE